MILTVYVDFCGHVTKVASQGVSQNITKLNVLSLVWAVLKRRIIANQVLQAGFLIKKNDSHWSVGSQYFMVGS
jgi:hypothetical protein